MNSEFISVDVSESVAAVTLNRPDKRNPLDWATVRQLKSFVTELENDKAVHVVVVRGAGGNFSAGGDMKGYIDLYRKPEDFRSFLQDFHAMLDAMEASSRIYVAAIEGYCVAGGRSRTTPRLDHRLRAPTCASAAGISFGYRKRSWTLGKTGNTCGVHGT